MAKMRNGIYFRIAEEPTIPIMECAFCGQEYRNHGVPVMLVGNRRAWGGDICGSCLTPDPREVAEICRRRAPVLRATRPDPDDDEDMNIKWADSMLVLAGMLDKVEDFKTVPGGIMALKVAEAYREIDGPQPRRTNKAA